MTSYNEIPYQSLPVSYTYLPHLAGLGKLFGLATTNPEECRVLEIGCAEGSNLITMAWHLPKSYFVGIDLSAVQIEQGQAIVDELSLPNINLITKDIEQLEPEDHEPFDYILLHGVFSWVSPHLQSLILQKIQALLSPNGLAYISYNTYPGWHSQMVLRDAIRLYCEDWEEPITKAGKITEALGFFKTFFKTADNEFSSYNTQQLTALEQHSSTYLYHEFLEEHNHPLYIRDFVGLLKDNQLQYLSDALLAVDNGMLLGADMNTFLRGANDRYKHLQYIDFIINQRFRRSLVCHEQQELQQQFSPEHMVGLSYRANIKSKKVPNLNSDKPCRFFLFDEDKAYMSISHPVSKAAIQILSEAYPSSIDYMQLLHQACQRVADHHGLAFIEAIEPYYQELYLLLIHDWITLDTEEKQLSAIDWDKKLYVSPLSHTFAHHHGYIPSFLLKAIDIDEMALSALDLLVKGISRKDLLKMLIDTSLGKQPFWSRSPKKKTKQRLEVFLETLEKNALLIQK